MLKQQSSSKYLTGSRRDYPAPPNATLEQQQWWAQVVNNMRQIDEELDSLRAAVNDLSQPKPA